MKKLEEEWKPIPDYPGYEVSNLGRVKSYKAKGSVRGIQSEGRLIKGSTDEDGYWRNCIRHRTGKIKVVKTHKLVLLAFVGERPKNKPHVRHLDGDKNNNSLNNLCYGTAKQNVRDTIKHGTFNGWGGVFKGHKGVAHPNSKLTEAQVLAMRGLRELGLTGLAIADIYGISQGQAYKILSRDMWSHI